MRNLFQSGDRPNKKNSFKLFIKFLKESNIYTRVYTVFGIALAILLFLTILLFVTGGISTEDEEMDALLSEAFASIFTSISYLSLPIMSFIFGRRKLYGGLLSVYFAHIIVAFSVSVGVVVESNWGSDPDWAFFIAAYVVLSPFPIMFFGFLGRIFFPFEDRTNLR